MPKQSSYAQILKSSSIVGGAQFINVLIGVVQTKAVAVLLGPSGVGLVSLYQSTLGMIGTISELGIKSSGVREVAEATSSGSIARTARTIGTLRRVCWLTGGFGWLLCVLLAVPLSHSVIDSPNSVLVISLLGASLLLTAINGGQLALIQGTRRIRDLAKANVLSTLTSAISACSIYYYYGVNGIAPVIILNAAIGLVYSRWFSGKIHIPNISLTWRRTWMESKRLLALGLVLMWSAVAASTVTFGIRILIVQDLGISLNGIYQAAWGLSGVMSGFIISAMGADFYPRLTAVAKDDFEVNRLVNEQTEIGLMLAVPGVLILLTFSRALLNMFYTSEFLAGEGLFPSLMIGVLGRVISWPMGYILIAKGVTKWLVLTETLANATHLVFVMLLLPRLGLEGAAVAFGLLYFFHAIGMRGVVRKITGFRWSAPTKSIVLFSTSIVFISTLSKHFLHERAGMLVGVLLIAVSLAYSLRGIFLRIREDSLVSARIRKLPLVGRYFE